MPVSYQREMEDEEETQQQPEVELSDTLTEPSSEDTWKGIAPVPRPLVPPSDEVSSTVWICSFFGDWLSFLETTLFCLSLSLNRRVICSYLHQ